MPRKLLMLASFIVLILVALFIYMMKNKEHPLAQTQQEVPKESDGTFVKSVPVVNPSPPKQANKNSEPLVKRGLEELKEEAEGIQPEVASETEAPETESSETKMSPEREELFMAVKQLTDQQRAIFQEEEPFAIELAKLNHRQIEIGLYDLVGADSEKTQRLHQEFQRNQKRMEELHAVVDPLVERRLQLRGEFEQKHGMSLGEFYETYGEEYKSWTAGL